MTLKYLAPHCGALYLLLYCLSAQALEGYVATGGKQVGATLCPQQYNDLIVPVPSLSPAVDAHEPEMTVAGMWAFINREQITSIDQLLAYLPEYYRTNFSLMEHTRATGQSDLEHPRIILFGPDGSFLANVGTKPDDPKYNLLDIAQLHRDTGEWEFSVLDFRAEVPQLVRRDPSCNECHGVSNKRPVWGDHLLWDGAFGDNLADGPNGEALDHTHAAMMNAIRAGEGSERFRALIWDQSPLRRGGKRKLANHAFGADLLMSNVIMGSAAALSAFRQLQLSRPDAYAAARNALLLLHFEQRGHLVLTSEERLRLSKRLSEHDLPVDSLDEMMRALGLNPAEAFSLNTLATKERSNPYWKAGAGDLYDMVMLQVLSDAAVHDANITSLLKNTHSDAGVIDCPDLLTNIDELVQFKMLHLFRLQGRARYEVHRVYYPLDLEDIHSRVFLPLTHGLTGYLRAELTSDSSVSMAWE